MDVAEEVGGEFVVAGGEASAVLEAAEHPLDGVAALVEGLAEAAFPAPVALGRDVGKRALLLDQVTDAIAVISTKGERSAVAIGNGVDLGVASAPADADRLGVRAPFPPAAERCAFTCVLRLVRQQRMQPRPLPDAQPNSPASSLSSSLESLNHIKTVVEIP